VWLEKQPNPRRIEDGSSYSKVPAHLIQAIPNVAESQARMEVQIRAYQCLVALKLWKYRTNRVPADLATVAKAAGLRQVPIDSYSGQPLRMAIINGEPVVYSVGKDGRDDGGRVDSDFDRKPGDQTFRLPTVEKRKR